VYTSGPIREAERRGAYRRLASYVHLLAVHGLVELDGTTAP
jgi:hypothetical protein